MFDLTLNYFDTVMWLIRNEEESTRSLQRARQRRQLH